MAMPHEPAVNKRGKPLACTAEGPDLSLLAGCCLAYIYVFLGRFSIKDVVPSKEGESSKIKVKVRLDIHGVLKVVNASLVEKLAVAPEPEEESMEVEGQDEKARQKRHSHQAKILCVITQE